MATSGTSAFNLDLTEIVEEAFERNGSELRTGYDLKTARRSLNLLFADWANRGLNMGTFEQGSQVLTPGVATYDLPADTVEATVIPRINFDTAWSAYPKRLGRRGAERHFNASVKTDKDFDDLMQAIKNYSEYVAGKEEQYIKMGSTFFNNWRDWIKGSVLIDSAEAIQDKIQKAMELTNNQPRGNYGGLFDSR